MGLSGTDAPLACSQRSNSSAVMAGISSVATRDQTLRECIRTAVSSVPHSHRAGAD